MNTKILNALCALVGLGMLVFGSNKLLNFMPVPEMPKEQMDALMNLVNLKWLMPLIGIAEMVGGVLLAIPRTRLVGALVLLPVLVGILLHHITFEPAGIIVGLVFFIVVVWALFTGKSKLLNLLN